jgi:ATP-binding cassette subfamily B protein
MRKISFREFASLLPYFARYRRQYLWGFVFLVIVDAAQVLIPQFMRGAVDRISSGNFRWPEILPPALAMVLTMAVISLGRYLWRYFIHGSSRRIETEMRGRLFDHLLTLSYDFFQKNKIGDLMARATNDINAVRMAMGWGLVALVDGTIMASAILVIIFVQDFKTAAFAVLPLPFITVLIILFGKTVGKRFLRAQETYSAMSETVQETFAGIRVVKSFVKEWWFTKKFADANDDYREANMALVRVFGIFFPLITFLSGLTSLILLLAGGMRVVDGFMTPGELVALFSYFQMLIWPLMGAGFMVNMIQRGAAALARVNEVMGTKPSICSPASIDTLVLSSTKPSISSPASIDVSVLSLTKPSISSSASIGSPALAAEAPAVKSPALEFRGLSFAYPDGTAVLEDVSLAVEEGSVLGILGRTGSGKTTLIKTLVRLVDPPEGTVFVQGVDVRRWDLQALRGHFGVTLQDSYLFSDSIKNNIAYGLDEPDPRRVSAAAAVSAIDRDLNGFSRGWDTLIGERGLTLSGGQKQRVAISRAVIGGAECVILDDALSAVDVETEKRILRGLMEDREEKRRGGRNSTFIIISHRVSTLAYADKVLVLEKGRIAEYGSPRELAAAGAFYARTAALQRLEQDGGREAPGV